MTKIALLGAGSSVGRYILPRTGAEVIGIYRGHRALSQLCDLDLGPRLKKASNREELVNALRGCGTAVNLVNDENPAQARQSLADLIEACVAAGVPQLIHMSSATVYGSGAARVTRLDEEPSGLTWSSYAAGKRWQESLLRQQRDRLPSIVVLRPGLIWGPGMAWLNKPASELARGEAWIAEGDATCNLVHVALVHQAIEYFVREKPAGLQFCNIADRERFTWRQYYEKIAAAIGFPADVRIDTVPRRSRVWWHGLGSLRYVFPFGIGWSILTPGPKNLLKRTLRPMFGPKAVPPLRWGGPSVAVDRESWELKAYDGPLPGCEHLKKIHASYRPPEPTTEAQLKSALANFPLWV